MAGDVSRVEDELRGDKQARGKKTRSEFTARVHMSTLNGS